MILRQFNTDAQVVDVARCRKPYGSNSRQALTGFFLPRFGFLLFCFGLFSYYVFVPLVVYFFGSHKDIYLLLAQIGLASIFFLIVGYFIPLTDSRFKVGASRLVIDENLFNGMLWVYFIVFMVLVLYSAPSIPLLSAFKGASADDLSLERGEFLKAREGLEIIFLYMTTILTSSLLPYSVVLLYFRKNRYRHLCAILFFAFCISFLQKSLFLNIVLPLLVYFGMAGLISKARLIFAVAFAFGVLVAGTAVSVDGPMWELHELGSIDQVFAADYSYGSGFGYFLWRAGAVPVFTASDTLFVFIEKFRGEEFLGATSNLISTALGMERINIERHVFEYQFGSWNEIANANAVFFVDAFVNFGWLGVAAFSLIVGQTFRMFSLSRDLGFKSLWPLFGFVLFSAPLIGMLLSNGFLYMILHGMFVTLRSGSARVGAETV